MTAVSPPAALGTEAVPRPAQAVQQLLIERVGSDAVARARRRLHLKAACIAASFVLGYALIVAAADRSLALVAVGVAISACCAYLGITSVMHDANHGAMFVNDRWGRVVGCAVDVLGGSSYVWRLKHNGIHHEHANVADLDPDIQQSPFLRLNRFQPWRPWYRWQHLYAPVLYGFMTLHVFASDFGHVVRRKLRGHTVETPSLAELGVLGVGKLVYVVWAFVLPWWLFGVVGVAVSLAATFVVSLGLALTVQVAHAVAEVEHVESLDGSEPARDPVAAFVRHQAAVSADVETRRTAWGWLVRFFAGGLDRQVAHHLAPELPHTLYPELTPHITELCGELGIAHRRFDGVRPALAAHFRWLRELGMRPA